MTAAEVAKLDLREFNRPSDQCLAELQKVLMPDHAEEILAIEPYSGEYVLGRTNREVAEEFSKRFPGKLSFRVRVDGGPVLKHSGVVRS